MGHRCSTVFTLIDPMVHEYRRYEVSLCEQFKNGELGEWETGRFLIKTRETTDLRQKENFTTKLPRKHSLDSGGGAHRNKTTPGPTRFGFVAKSVLLGPEPE